ncbi:MAG: carboxypeptidase regulatory-like domain-containing protein [Pyrinomonadaceae bacterium]
MPNFRRSKLTLAFCAALFASFAFVSDSNAGAVPEAEQQTASRFGIIKGAVSDIQGKPIANATVSVFRVGTAKLLKQVSAGKDGKFFAKIVPGTYTILAIAQGFNPITLKQVKVNRSSELVYGFELERSGNGKTLPEKRADRNSSKWRIRAATRRSIYQNTEGGDNTVAAVNAEEENENELVDTYEPFQDDKKPRNKSIVETYVANGNGGNFVGTNFATVQSLGNDSEIIYAGQIGTGKEAPKRFEATLNYRPSDDHLLNVRGSIVGVGRIKNAENRYLTQTSIQALDRWRVREGIIVVLGVDYSKFMGAGGDHSFSPRLGFQFDVDAKTRVRSSFTTQNEPRTWQRALELEGTQVLFRDPVAVEDVAVRDGKPLMNKNRRLEFGIERVLDNRSSVEANVFFDSVIGRGIGLANLPFNSLNSGQFGDLVATQHGKTQGVRVVFARRLNNVFSTSVGYSFGKGQKLSEGIINSPSSAFENQFFQTLFAEVSANFSTGTSVKTIYRLSSKATIFAIDPFQGRLAIYDPGLSILISQELPVWGLPIDAEAVIDAKNIMDQGNSIALQEGTLLINSQRRMIRGGILVRF